MTIALAIPAVITFTLGGWYWIADLYRRAS
jgi:hypothetical protein